jgi:hypothetical protein
MASVTNIKGKKTATPANDASGPLKLPEVDFRVALVRVRGISPLIVHAWSEKAKGMMRDKQQKQGRVAKEAKDPNADFLASKYLDDQGRDCVPAAGFRNAMISAGRFSEGVPMTIIRGSVFILGDLVPIENATCRMREDMVRVGGKGPGTGVADLRYRAEYTGWECALKVQFNANSLSLSQVLNLIRLAGLSVGLCEWRPEKNGQYGRFDIVGEVQELRGDAAVKAVA